MQRFSQRYIMYAEFFPELFTPSVTDSKQNFLIYLVQKLNRGLVIYLVQRLREHSLFSWYKDWTELIYVVLRYSSSSYLNQLQGCLSVNTSKLNNIVTDVCKLKWKWSFPTLVIHVWGLLRKQCLLCFQVGPQIPDVGIISVKIEPSCQYSTTFCCPGTDSDDAKRLKQFSIQIIDSLMLQTDKNRPFCIDVVGGTKD